MTTSCTKTINTPPPPETAFVHGNLIDVAVYARTLSDHLGTGTATTTDIHNLEHAYTLAINASRWLITTPQTP
ncbi:hypothetical protein [Actinokineospora sp. NBRC 105648]|uniref:hypothetical protein n=1 Tax=Actinokineospora sp. NBRC 105648 TaxID=3032206 RepID=UPI00249F98EB|nr:hypothetical protein [Actinokineospora sp. NBRC 105648]GLZ37159.1 hypothetical protein Acsp05_07840 [Actinokineospora sp. NBRC 105648]